MLDKHLTFCLFAFRVSIVVAILESVASEPTVLCQTDSKDTTTQNTAEEKDNKTSSKFPIWASAIIAIIGIAALILVVFLIICYVRKKRTSRAASQESKDDDLMESKPTVYAMPMKKRAVISPFIRESAIVTVEEQPSMVLVNLHALVSSATNPTECPLYSNLSQAETNMASQLIQTSKLF
ncbi:uncharacterized protein LOC134177126 isoform X2 [Corticium candelabrum]|nr:uncharacterized protein LOC134177126 isoform X2 [Corticium candelabrum]